MSKIININGKVVKIGDDNGKIITVPITDLTFSNPKVGDQVEVYKDKNDVIVNLSKTKMAMPSLKKPNVSKKLLVVIGCIVGAIVLVVCAIKFIPLMLDEDLRTESTYPEYYANLKEEKEAYTKALEACNKAAESSLKAKGITVKYEWNDVEAVRKSVSKDDDGAAHIYLSDVQPTGGEKEYKSYGMRDYDCKTNTAGSNVQDIYVTYAYN